MLNVDEAFMMLDWHRQEAEQAEGRSRLASSDIEDITFLVMPSAGKNFWENSAKALTMMGRPRIDPVLPKLMEWLRDMNWPGAGIVLEFLNSQQHHSIQKFLGDAKNQAESEQDDEWLSNLSLVTGR